MRIFGCLLFAAILITGCTSSKTYLSKGNYDAAIRKAVPKLRKNPAKEKEAIVLDKAYKLANDADNSKIKFLKQEGNPDIWDDVFNIYSRMKERQALVKTVLPLTINGQKINYPQVDYDQEIIAAKRRAAEYFYAHGKKLLEAGDKKSARDAYYEFENVKKYFKEYEDVDNYLKKAKMMGTNHVKMQLSNNTMFKITREFEKMLLDHDYMKLNSMWVEHHNDNANINYDYIAEIQLRIIDVSPEKVYEKETIETKEIRDGWEYVLDNQGNVMKDSVGNDIKTPKYKTITCKVLNVSQSKAAHIEGDIIYTRTANNKTIKKIPVAADNFFDHHCATANGDVNALSDETKKMLGNKPLPFPADIEMIYQAGENLRISIFNALRDNRDVVN